MLKKILYVILFIISLGLVIKGNTIPGYSGLAVMTIGLAGLLTELYMYNKQYQ